MKHGWRNDAIAHLPPGLHLAPTVGIHLAIFREPFLSLILHGNKTIESRFSLHPIAPYDHVRPGDLLLLKETSGPIRGITFVRRTEYHARTAKGWNAIRARYARALCAEEPSFWKERDGKRYASLLFLTGTHAVKPFSITKQDRRPWVVLRTSHIRTSLAQGAPVIAISGQIKTGKTTLAKALGAELPAQTASFGGYLRASLATSERSILATEGQRRVETDPGGFTRDVLAASGWVAGQPLIVDGIRHHAIFEVLARLVAPQSCTLVFLDLADDALTARRRASGVTSPGLDNHPTERDVRGRLREAADLILDATKTPRELRDDVIAFLRMGGPRPDDDPTLEIS